MIQEFKYYFVKLLGQNIAFKHSIHHPNMDFKELRGKNVYTLLYSCQYILEINSKVLALKPKTKTFKLISLKEYGKMKNANQ